MIETAAFEKLSNLPITLSDLLDTPPGKFSLTSRPNLPCSRLIIGCFTWVCVSSFSWQFAQALCLTRMGHVSVILRNRN